MKPKGTQLNTIIDGTKEPPVVRADWLTFEPKKGNVSVADAIEYIESEESAKLLDPPGSARSIAKGTRRAHALAVGISHSGLTLDAIAKLVAPLCPRPSGTAPMTEGWVKRVIAGLCRLDVHLDGGDE